MSTPFNAHHGLIIVMARLWGPQGDAYARLALDTAATATVVRTAKLVSIGYDPATAPNRVQMTTGSGVEYAPSFAVDRLKALGQERVPFTIIAHTLPPSASVDGVLGLDFFRNQELILDFRSGRITLQ